MTKADLAEEQLTEPTHMMPVSNLDTSMVSRMDASTAVMLIGAGAVAIVLPFAILTLILFLMGA